MNVLRQAPLLEARLTEVDSSYTLTIKSLSGYVNEFTFDNCTQEEADEKAAVVMQSYINLVDNIQEQVRDAHSQASDNIA